MNNIESRVAIAAIISVAVVLSSMFYAMSVPTPVKQRSPAEVMEDVVRDKGVAINNCIVNAVQNHSTNTLSAKDNADIMAACSAAIAQAVQPDEQKLDALIKENSQ